MYPDDYIYTYFIILYIYILYIHNVYIHICIYIYIYKHILDFSPGYIAFMLTTNRVFVTRFTLQEMLPNRSRSKGAFVVFLINHIDAQHVTEQSL